MSNIVFLGFPNHISQPYSTLSSTGTGEPAEMGPEWLKTEEPSDRSRKTTLDPLHTLWKADFNNLALRLDGFAVINHNGENGGQFRFIASDLPFNYTQQVLLPSALVGSSNCSGTAADIDEAINSPDGSTIGPTSPSSQWSTYIDFPTPPLPPSTGPSRAAFVVVARRAFTGGATSGNAISAPTLSLRLAAGNGVTYALSLGSRPVMKTAVSGQILIFPFNPADLYAATGVSTAANLQCQVVATTATHAAGNSYILVDALACYYEDSTSATFTNDSGWLTISGHSFTQPLDPTRTLHWFPSSAWTGITTAYLLFRGDQTQHDPPTTDLLFEVPALSVVQSPPSFVEAGVWCGGEKIEPAHGIRKGSGPLSRTSSANLAGLTAGGQSFGADSYRRRSTDTLDLLVTRAEADRLTKEIAFRRGSTGAFYVALDPGADADFQSSIAWWATLKPDGLSAAVPAGRYKPGGTMLFHQSISLDEKL